MNSMEYLEGQGPSGSLGNKMNSSTYKQNNKSNFLELSMIGGAATGGD
jgi:hypothetical protein